MEEEEARKFVKDMLAIWPQVKNYWAESSTNKTATYESWIKALRTREAAALYAVLEDWEYVACDKNFICAPVQHLIQLADAYRRRHTPKPALEPPNRDARETNMLESFLAGLAARESGQDLSGILEGVK